MVYKKHDHNCDTCKVFKIILNKNEIYFLCDDVKMPLEPDGFPIVARVMEQGCSSWIRR